MRKFLRKYFVIILIVLVVVLALLSGYLYKRSVNLRNPERVATEESKDLARKVGRHVVVPTDELPKVATVSDPSALKGQEFFADAKIGDKVLIYEKAKKAILYDPKADRVIVTAPLTVGVQQ